VTALLSETRLDEPQRHELLTVINEESDRLDHLIGEAMEMARLDAGKTDLRLEVGPIQEPVQAAVESLKRVLDGHPLQIHLPDGLPRLRMDTARVKEVLVQLIDNAAKYSSPGAPIHVSAEAKDGRLVVSVADHGPGLDDFEQSLVFDKFYRGRDHRLRVQGTGMGLAIARAIIEAHGGTIGVTSQLGHGSVFSFALPTG
jgi:two-component system sensor histidine kinase KdpD